MEQAIVDAIAQMRFPAATAAAKWITFLGEWWVLLVAVLAGCFVLLLQKRTRAALTFGAGYVALLTAVYVLKEFVQRPRPVGGIIEDGLYSFPSAHSALAMYFFTLVTFTFVIRMRSGSSRALTMTALLIAPFLIAFTRIYLGVHYPSDIIFGLLLGVAFAYGAIWVIKKQEN